MFLFLGRYSILLFMFEEHQVRKHSGLPSRTSACIGRPIPQRGKDATFPACEGHFPRGFIGYSKGFPPLRHDCRRRPRNLEDCRLP